jgi:alanine racemase
MPNLEDYSTWVEVDLGAIENNIRRMMQLSGVQVMAVVKANAYGHGAVPVARAALQAGAAWCGVARLEEALELRRAGLDCPILLLGYTPSVRLDEAVANRVSLPYGIWTRSRQPRHLGGGWENLLAFIFKLIQVWDAWGCKLKRPFPYCIRFHLRIYSLKGYLPILLAQMKSAQTATEIQERRFNLALQALEAAGGLPPLVHACNSAAGLTRPGARFNLVRAGIAIYGLHPSAECPLHMVFCPPWPGRRF